MSRAAANIAMMSLAAIGAAQLLYTMLAPDSFGRGLIWAATTDPEPPPMSNWKVLDDALHTALRNEPTNANVLADFPGAASADAQSQRAIGAIYARAIYAAWPKRLYFAPPSNVILNGEQLFSAHPPTDRDFLVAHNIHSIVHLSFDSVRKTPVARLESLDHTQ